MRVLLWSQDAGRADAARRRGLDPIGISSAEDIEAHAGHRQAVAVLVDASRDPGEAMSRARGIQARRPAMGVFLWGDPSQERLLAQHARLARHADG